MLFRYLLDGGETNSGNTNTMFECFVDSTHNGSIDAQASHQQIVMPGFRGRFSPPLMSFYVMCVPDWWLLLLLGRRGKRE